MRATMIIALVALLAITVDAASVKFYTGDSCTANNTVATSFTSGTCFASGAQGIKITCGPKVANVTQTYLMENFATTTCAGNNTYFTVGNVADCSHYIITSNGTSTTYSDIVDCSVSSAFALIASPLLVLVAAFFALIRQ